MAKTITWKRTKRKVRCARDSTRTIKRGDVLLHICCPAGQWAVRKKRCKVGTRAFEVGRLK